MFNLTVKNIFIKLIITNIKYIIIISLLIINFKHRIKLK
jgi:hypothetical protein